ncbi:MAG: hypothetical protein OXG27_14510 [Chloroflexi bacterium]|nr:hypothetical protein [Chloroflexota bacterium]
MCTASPAASRPRAATDLVRFCLPAPSEDPDRARFAVPGRKDKDWTILDSTLEDGQLCAETAWVSRFVIVLEPESEEAAA